MAAITRMRRTVGIALLLACVKCGGDTPPNTPTAPAVLPVFPSATVAAAPEVFVGAGDIASCGSTGAASTARLLDGIGGTVFTLGDNAYPSGSAQQFRDCYDPTWGRHKHRTRP